MSSRPDPWIPVSKSMPDAEIAVLIACRDGDEPVWIGYHDGEIWRAADAMPVDVTHWQHLPEPPAEELHAEQGVNLRT